ncbi:MAG: hypothetical protein M3Y87_24615 [Myxococcota bacterium]|nr:hypothetical protein [Myxococcota bacterium]
MSVTVKGSTVTARVRWVRELYGEPGVRRLKDALDPESRRALEGRILPHEWVPFDLFVAVSTELDRLYGQGDLELCRELGRYSARANLPTLYRIFYSLGSPAFIIRRAARVWDVHYSSGRLDAHTATEDDGVESARLRIIGFQTPHRTHCLAVVGWCEQSVQLSGGKLVGPAFESQCRTRGDAVCEIVARWR